MTSILVELKAGKLILAQVHSTATTQTVSAVKEFAWTPEIDAGKPLENASAFASFLRACIDQAGFREKKIVLSLEDAFYVQKDFMHPKTNEKNLKLLARLEADTILHGDAITYSIGTCRYGNRVNRDGEYQTALYALPIQTILELKKECEKQRLNLYHIVPRTNAFVQTLFKMLKETSKVEYQQKCFAVINLNAERTRVAVMHESSVVNTHVLSSAFSDMLQTVMDEKNCTREQASEFIHTTDIFALAQTDDLCGKLQILVNMMIENVVRTVHFSAASERLNVEGLLLSGEFSNVTGLQEYISQTYEVEVGLLSEVFDTTWKSIRLPKNETAGFLDPLMVCGSYSQPVNLIGELIEKKKVKVTTTMVCSIMTVLVLGCMLLQPAIYFINKSMTEKAQQRLEDPSMVEIRQILDEDMALKTQADKLTNDIALFPYGVSKSNVYTQLLRELFTDTTIDNFTFNFKDGSVIVNFTVALYEDYLTISNRVLESEVFELNVPFTATPKEKGVSYSVGLKLKEYAGYDIN